MVIVISIFIYLVFQVFLGIWLSRNIASEFDYVVAGRSLGYTLTTFGIFATWFAAEGIMSASGAVFKGGIPAITGEHITWAIGILVLGIFFASRLRKMELTTFGDLFRKRYGPLVEKLTTFVLIPASLFWAAGQIRAFGVVISGFSDINMTLAISIAAASVIIYTTFGGMLADSYTDLIQGLMLILGLVLLVGFMIADGGLHVFRDIPSEHFQMASPDTPVFERVQSWMIGIFGTVIAVELIARILSAKSPKVAKWSTIMGGGLFIIILCMPILMGFVGSHLFESLDDPEQLIILQAEHYMPTIMFVLFMGALISAILSTVDSTLLTIGSLLAHNVVLRIMKNPKENRRLYVNRLMVVILGILAYALAISADSVHQIVYAGASFGTAGIVVIYLFSFQVKFGGRWAALTAISFGSIVPFIGDNFVDFMPYPYLTGFVLALIGYVLVGSWEYSHQRKIQYDEI